MTEAERWASQLAKSEGEAFEKSLLRIKEEKTMMIHGRHYSEPELQAHIEFMENKILELEDKHLNECRQISEYDEELRKLRELLHRVRSFYGDQVPWMDIFEEQYMQITGGKV